MHHYDLGGSTRYLVLAAEPVREPRRTGWCDIDLVNMTTRTRFACHHYDQPVPVEEPTAAEAALFMQFQLAPETVSFNDPD